MFEDIASKIASKAYQETGAWYLNNPYINNKCNYYKICAKKITYDEQSAQENFCGFLNDDGDCMFYGSTSNFNPHKGIKSGGKHLQYIFTHVLNDPIYDPFEPDLPKRNGIPEYEENTPEFKKNYKDMTYKFIKNGKEKTCAKNPHDKSWCGIFTIYIWKISEVVRADWLSPGVSAKNMVYVMNPSNWIVAVPDYLKNKNYTLDPDIAAVDDKNGTPKQRFITNSIIKKGPRKGDIGHACDCRDDCHCNIQHHCIIYEVLPKGNGVKAEQVKTISGNSYFQGILLDNRTRDLGTKETQCNKKQTTGDIDAFYTVIDPSYIDQVMENFKEKFIAHINSSIKDLKLHKIFIDKLKSSGNYKTIDEILSEMFNDKIKSSFNDQKLVESDKFDNLRDVLKDEIDMFKIFFKDPSDDIEIDYCEIQGILYYEENLRKLDWEKLRKIYKIFNGIPILEFKNNWFDVFYE